MLLSAQGINGLWMDVPRQLFLFGPGFAAQALARRLGAQGWRACGTARTPEAAAALAARGIAPVDLADPHAVAEALAASSAVLVAAPPSEAGCPGLSALAPALEAGARPRWIGYLSTTGVYGDRGGGWVSEASDLAPVSVQGARRVEAERAWLAVGARLGLDVAVFRLPGLYGPGRSALDRVREGGVNIVKPGQVFSRLHVGDLAAALAASIAQPRAGAIYNACDDEPCPPQDVLAWAAALLGLAPPAPVSLDDPSVSPASRRFYAENKRVSNARIKAELGWRPAYPSYREGLAAIFATKTPHPRRSSS